MDKVFGSAFDGRGVEAVIHFAGLKAVGESVELPLRYYTNNITGTLVLLQAMQRAHVRTLVFSSSATVYGAPERMPITEDFPLGAVNPYGRTKEHIEGILTDLAASTSGVPPTTPGTSRCCATSIPVGAHASGRIGEDPAGIPNNLMPYVAQVAVGRRPELVIHGDDYPTPDGTAIRDYVHVVDLARGHLAALQALPDHPGARAWNLGTGTGFVGLRRAARVRASGRPRAPVAGRAPPTGRRADVLLRPVAGRGRAGLEGASSTLDDMCADAWRWQSANPDGYPE